MSDNVQEKPVSAVLTITLENVTMGDVTALYNVLQALDEIRASGTIALRVGNGAGARRPSLVRRP